MHAIHPVSQDWLYGAPGEHLAGEDTTTAPGRPPLAAASRRLLFAAGLSSGLAVAAVALLVVLAWGLGSVAEGVAMLADWRLECPAAEPYPSLEADPLIRPRRM